MKTNLVIAILIIFIEYAWGQNSNEDFVKKIIPSPAVRNSIFYEALRYKDSIQLTSEQVHLLIKRGYQLDSIVHIPVISLSDIAPDPNLFEKKHIKFILDPKQYMALKKLVNRKIAKQNSILYWSELRINKLSDKFDSTIAVKQMTNYEYKRLFNIEFSQDSSNIIEKEMPKPLWKLRIIRRIDTTNRYTNPSKFFDAIKMKRILSLSDTQIDTLAKYGFEMDHIFWVNRIPSRGKWTNPYHFEANNLPRILTEEQYTTFLIERNRQEAKSEAYKSWVEIKKANFVNPIDSTKVKKNLDKYFLAQRVTFERYKFKRDQRISSLNALDDTMPMALRKLKAAQADSTGTSKRYRGTIKW